MSNEGHLVERAVREAAELMGLNPDRISPADRLRCFRLLLLSQRGGGGARGFALTA
jgi:hypothetical protein